MRDVAGYFDAVRGQVRAGELVLISAEPLYRHVSRVDEGEEGRRLDGGAAYLGDPLPYIQALRQAIGQFDVKVVIMLRRQDLFLESLYSEQIMARDYTDDIEQFAEERAWMLDYDARLGEWASVFGQENIDVRVFEPRRFEVPLERYFIEWIGGEWDNSLTMGGSTNITVPRDLVEFKRELNKQWVRNNNATIRSWLEELAARFPQRFATLGKAYLDDRSRQGVMARVEDGNRRVAQTYLGRDELFFDSELPSYPEPRPLTRQRYTQLSRVLLNELARRERGAAQRGR